MIWRWRNRRRLTLRERILAAFVGTAAVTLCVNLTSMSLVRSSLLGQVDSDLQNQASIVAAALAQHPSEQSLLVTINSGVRTDAFVEVTRAGSATLRNSVAIGSQQLHGAPKSFPLGYLTHGAWRYLTITQSRRVTVTIGESLGDYLHTSSLVGLEQVVATFVSLVLLVILSAWVISIGVKPVARIAGVARRISGGVRSERIEVPDRLEGTEFSDVADAMNTMVDGFEELVEIEAELNAELRRFVADAGHELRTPLTSVSGYAQLLDQGGLDEAARHDALARIQSECGRMTRVVEDLMSLARLEGSVALRYEHFDLAALVDDLVSDHRMADGAESHPVEVIATDRPLWVDADVDRISQIVVNLLANFRNHTPAGTHASFKVAPHAGGVLLEYSDNGPGVADPSKIFTRFWRADLGRRGASSGLGMSIVEAIVRAHGGEVSARRGLPRGLCVSIILPPLD